MPKSNPLTRDTSPADREIATAAQQPRDDKLVQDRTETVIPNAAGRRPARRNPCGGEIE